MLEKLTIDSVGYDAIIIDEGAFIDEQKFNRDMQSLFDGVRATREVVIIIVESRNRGNANRQEFAGADIVWEKPLPPN